MKKVKQSKSIALRTGLVLILTLMICCKSSQNLKNNVKLPEAPPLPGIKFKYAKGVHYINDKEAILLRDWLIDYYYFLEKYELYKEVLEKDESSK